MRWRLILGQVGAGYRIEWRDGRAVEEGLEEFGGTVRPARGR